MDNDSSLTLGKNIILSSSYSWAIAVSVSTGKSTGPSTPAYLTMLNGSKIIGNIEVGHNSTITINGGIITGKITIYEGELTLSGNAEVDNITLWARGSGNRKFFVSNDWSGRVEVLDLAGTASLDDVKGAGIYGGFSGNSVVHASPGYTLTQADIARFPLGNFLNHQGATEPISDTHKLELDIVNNVIKLVAR
jgi:hypothetical protein